jgi:ArsR family transcriptional regulator, arsenate/arsenite/antimonite-responsive transcriptional repressor
MTRLGAKSTIRKLQSACGPVPACIEPRERDISENMRKNHAGASVTLSDQQFHAISRALADPRRFAILQQIAAAGSMACGTLHEHESISPATISHHVKELSEAGLVKMERQGRSSNLSLCRPVFQAYVKRLACM